MMSLRFMCWSFLGDKDSNIVSIAHQAKVMCRQTEDYRFSGADIVEIVKIVQNKDVVAAVATAANSRQKVSARRQLEIMDSQSVRGAISKLRSLLPGAFEGM